MVYKLVLSVWQHKSGTTKHMYDMIVATRFTGILQVLFVVCVLQLKHLSIINLAKITKCDLFPHFVNFLIKPFVG